MPDITDKPAKLITPPAAKPGAAITAPATAAIFVAIPGTSLIISRKSFPSKPNSSSNKSCGPSIVGMVIIIPNLEGL